MAEESKERTQQNAGTYRYSGPRFPWMVHDDTVVLQSLITYLDRVAA